MTRQEQITSFVRANPGCHFVDIRESLGLNIGNASRLVSDAEKARLIHKIGRRRLYRFYPGPRPALTSVFDLAR